MVGVAGFEPTASSSRTKRATKLRHTPLKPGHSIAPAHRLAKRIRRAASPLANVAHAMVGAGSTDLSVALSTLSLREGEAGMTGLGAALYGGFFGLAALWLFLTAERSEGVQTPDQPTKPVRSNSFSAEDASVGSSAR